MTAAMTLLDLEASIYAAYARMVRFPAGWTDDQRNQYLSDHAGSLVDSVFDQYDDLLGDGLIICGTSADDFDAMSVRTKDNREYVLRQALILLPTQMQTPDDSYFD
ncbi:MAG TPA: hypothetical protein PK331_15610 [Gordonia sp. (in: high G+C Gram-positive bacteria)]|uniref:hypothetical protein n=1 Tax=Gordonia sp. (in: high G+C Gram-positive bacteria) TaxID=84139 RepID=UPI002B5CB556|nr:hypothetical protein [Gordonia sp. (in: high G+C Gram-positive bacteria)]HNP58662.1 hypothetical protein [Gordonia sp. (in: high G+C Gram-positive bacteria)]HRC52337.1 hypothetical protein [Gordonia sp. (in: high G+C Gram-positive bacteria)]